MSGNAATVDLSRVDRLWRCTRCGYLAFSFPYEDLQDDEGKDAGTFIHTCPECGEQDWHWCGGDDREKRIGYLQEFLRGR